ncbi:protein phosphatase methylesterase [Wallemia mellicola]|nr:protein phosphatase methylesterase [Wallemia mellicola]TIB83848.1 protein phosphatase methylesterase [Wallemia mellicola]TIB99966.1 protein phosphatase methylesterase [Wallemia mellicola]TIC38031.1 protein phosphatase methylesterase [Wallemia mellicola]TIC45154.1 protein phosphatase methylesterase [Wallemia mellicola]
MSLRRELAAKLSKLPADLPLEDTDEADEAADQLGSLGQQATSTKSHSMQAEYTPLSGQNYFDEALEIETKPGCIFRVYYSAPIEQRNATVVVFHQGAGYTGLSFACLAKELRRLSNGKLGMLSFDARAHGKTRIEDGNEYEMSLETLSNDLTQILAKLFTDKATNPQFILAGHSMGGSICSHAVKSINQLVGKVVGLCVLDAVEGTAMEALPSMAGIVNSNPQSFTSLSQAISWHISNRVIHNPESARLSVPSMVVEKDGKWYWRTDLLKTEPYWSDWFKGLSNKFISAPTAKLLILAGADKLDTPLMIAQMQGKFQLNVIQNVGHCLQEDDPARVADLLYAFYERNVGHVVDLAKIKKVGQA